MYVDSYDVSWLVDLMATVASGFLARESIELANLTVPNQPFGEFFYTLRVSSAKSPIGMVTNSNVSLTDKASGIMGLGFPRLSSIANSTVNCMLSNHLLNHHHSFCLLQLRHSLPTCPSKAS